MQKYVRLVGTVVVEIIESENIDLCFHPDFVSQLITVDDGVELGMALDNGKFTFVSINPTQDELRAVMIVTKLKAKQNLKLAGKLNFVLDAMDAEPRDSDIRILWDESPEFHRLDSALVKFCKEKMGMTDEDIDGLFLQ